MWKYILELLKGISILKQYKFCCDKCITGLGISFLFFPGLGLAFEVGNVFRSRKMSTYQELVYIYVYIFDYTLNKQKFLGVKICKNIQQRSPNYASKIGQNCFIWDLEKNWKWLVIFSSLKKGNHVFYNTFVSINTLVTIY